jgi:hypothetical protein
LVGVLAGAVLGSVLFVVYPRVSSPVAVALVVAVLAIAVVPASMTSSFPAVYGPIMVGGSAAVRRRERVREPRLWQ